MNPTKPTAAAMFSKIWFWLFTRRQCSWHNGYMGGNPLADKITNGICPCCERKERLKLVKPIIGQLDEPQTPFVVLNLKSK